MTLAAALRTREELSAAIGGAIRSPAGRDGLRRALSAEHLRTAVYAASFSPDQSRRMVHTTRLLSGVRGALEGLWGQEQSPGADSEDWARSALQALAEIGDVVTVGGGYWLATPLRLIELPGADGLLVLGSDPADVVASKLGAAPYCSGVGRFIAQASLKRSSNHLALVNPVETWLGPSDPLPLWTANILSAYAKRLSAPDEIDADQLEVYAPDIMRRQRRPTPWVAASHISHALPELRICRPLAAHARSWNWPHYLGAFNFAHGGLRLRQSVSLDLDVSARLRFGFDQLLGSPRTASIAIQRDCCVLDVRFGLPAPESKIKSLGWSESERSDSRHLTTFHLSSLPFIQEGLNRLAIRQNLFERNR